MIDKEYIKSSCSLLYVYRGLTTHNLTEKDGKYTGLCPFHNDTNDGNFYIFLSSNRYHCFACGASGDVIEFVKQKLNISFPEACRYLEKEENLSPSNLPKLQTAQSNPELSDKSKEIYRYFFDSLKLTDNGKNYLLNRGFSEQTIKEFEVKSIDDPDCVYLQLKDQFSISDLQAAGLAGCSTKDGRDYFTFYLPCVIFTAKRNGHPVYFISRNITDEKKKRFFKPHKVKQEYFCGDLSDKEILIFEGAIDAMSYYQLTGKSNFIVLSGLNHRKYSVIKNLYPDKEIVAAFDNDEAGENAKEKLSAESGFPIKSLDYNKIKEQMSIKEHFKDYNDILKLSKSRDK